MINVRRMIGYDQALKGHTVNIQELLRIIRSTGKSMDETL